MSLIAKIIDKENINQAIDSVEKNEGSKTPGVDKLTIDYIIDNKSKVVDKINEVLSAGTYKPSPIRRVEIPKEKEKLDL
jgi:RNA-directed DNA polymerase